MTTTILPLAGISSQTCKPAIEGIVAAIAGVAAVEVNTAQRRGFPSMRCSGS